MFGEGIVNARGSSLAQRIDGVVRLVPFKLSGVCSTGTLRVKVPNNHILTPNLYYNYSYQHPKYQIIAHMDP